MDIDDLNTGQNGGQSTEFANQNQGQGFGQSQNQGQDQSQSFNPQPDPGVGTEDLSEDNGQSGQDDAGTSLGEDSVADDSLGQDSQGEGDLGEDSILPPSDSDGNVGSDSEPDMIDPLDEDTDNGQTSGGNIDGQSAA